MAAERSRGSDLPSHPFDCSIHRWGKKKKGRRPTTRDLPLHIFFYQALIAGHSARLVKSLAKETAIINIYISDNILDDIIYQHTFCVCCLVKGYIWGGHSVTYIQATIWDSWMDPGSRRSFVCAIHLFGFHHRPLSLLFGVSPFSSSTPPDIIWHSFFPSVSRAAAAADLDVYNPRLNSIWRVRDGISWLSFFFPLSLLSFHLRAQHDS